MRLVGRAATTDLPDAVLFEEEGTMTLGGYSGVATRATLFRPDGAVLFDDGRPFHTLVLSTGRARVGHECPPDRYDGRYRVLGPDAWLLTWRITGPRKAHRIASRYDRVPCGWAGRSR